MVYYVFVVKTLYDTRTVMASRRSSVFCLLDIMLMALGIMTAKQIISICLGIRGTSCKANVGPWAHPLQRYRGTEPTHRAFWGPWAHPLQRYRGTEPTHRAFWGPWSHPPKRHGGSEPTPLGVLPNHTHAQRYPRHRKTYMHRTKKALS